MRKILFMMAMILPFFVFTSCSKDDEPTFDYDLNMIYGTWGLDEVDTGNGYQNWILEETSATFKKDGSYYGRGYFGEGSGTYTAEGKTITCFVGGKEYIKYDVLDLNGNKCELRMYMTGSEEDIKIKCIKE